MNCPKCNSNILTPHRFSSSLIAPEPKSEVCMDTGLLTIGATLLMAIVVAVLILFKFPVDTAIRIYTFWVLLSAERREYYRIRLALNVE